MSRPAPSPRPAPAGNAAAAPLAVLHIIPTLGVGGTEHQLAKLLIRMDRTKFRQTVCWYTKSATFEADLNAAGIRTVFIDKGALSPWAFFARLRRVVREVRPDVVHTWLYSGNFWGRMAALSCGVRRFVSSDRGMSDPASPAVVLYERLLASRTTRLVNSRAAAESLRERYGLDARRIRVMPNGVDPAPAISDEARRAARGELGLPEAAPVVLMAARQAVEKNHPMYFRAARRVSERRPDAVFVALGYLFDPKAMTALLEETGVQRIVRVVEHREDIARWLAAADVFCLTSNHEGLPNVVLEAMAAGLPVVCTDFASAREILSDEGLGVIVPRGDDAALAAALLALIEDGSRRVRLGAAGRRMVRERFDWDRLVNDMQELYAVVARRTAGQEGRA